MYSPRNCCTDEPSVRPDRPIPTNQCLLAMAAAPRGKAASRLMRRRPRPRPSGARAARSPPGRRHLLAISYDLPHSLRHASRAAEKSSLLGGRSEKMPLLEPTTSSPSTSRMSSPNLGASRRISANLLTSSPPHHHPRLSLNGVVAVTDYSATRADSAGGG